MRLANRCKPGANLDTRRYSSKWYQVLAVPRSLFRSVDGTATPQFSICHGSDLHNFQVSTVLQASYRLKDLENNPRTSGSIDEFRSLRHGLLHDFSIGSPLEPEPGPPCTCAAKMPAIQDHHTCTSILSVFWENWTDNKNILEA